MEFDYVFILDFSRFYYPHKDEIENLNKKKSATSKDFLDDQKEIEDKEKRILYVSLTRTKLSVFLYYVASENPKEKISPFVKDFNLKDFEAKGFKKTMI